MHRKRSFGWHLNGLVIGTIAMAMRLIVLFAVIGLAYAIFMHFGARWFYVFIFAAMAFRLHLELSWIERHFSEQEEAREQKPNPFRKR
jgi:hypothetical protein